MGDQAIHDEIVIYFNWKMEKLLVKGRNWAVEDWLYPWRAIWIYPWRALWIKSKSASFFKRCLFALFCETSILSIITQKLVVRGCLDYPSVLKLDLQGLLYHILLKIRNSIYFQLSCFVIKRKDFVPLFDLINSYFSVVCEHDQRPSTKAAIYFPENDQYHWIWSYLVLAQQCFIVDYEKSSVLDLQQIGRFRFQGRNFSDHGLFEGQKSEWWFDAHLIEVILEENLYFYLFVFLLKLRL